MPFESGSTALMICTLGEKLPDDFLERLAKYSAGRLDDVKDEPTVGWVSGRHLLESEISEMTSICGGHLYVNLRKAERKIPSQLLKAICRKEELAYMQANNMITVPRAERKRIKEDAIERNLMKMPPTISATPIIVDRALNVMYVGSASLSGFDTIAAEFARAMEIEPVPVTVPELMVKLFRASDVDLPRLSFNGRDEGEAVPGRDFLTWLWYHAETNEGRLKIKDLGEFHLIIEGPLSFAALDLHLRRGQLHDDRAESPGRRGDGTQRPVRGTCHLPPHAACGAGGVFPAFRDHGHGVGTSRAGKRHPEVGGRTRVAVTV